MTNLSQLLRFLQVTLVGGALIGTLAGCQPTTTESAQAPSDDTVTTDTDAHDEHADHSEDEHAEHSDHDEHDHSGHDHASKSTPFECEPTATIGVYYHNDSTPQTAHLLIDGIEYDLSAATDSPVPAQTYIGDIGLDDTHGLIWQVDGDNKATLMNKTLDNTVAVAAEKVLFNCHNANS